MVRQRINCNAPLFSPADYDFIIQRRDDRLRKKVLDELMGKYNTSMKRIYQIWRGEEANRIAWNQSINQSIVDNSNTTYAGGLIKDSPSASPQKKNSRKKKTSVASTEMATEVLPHNNTGNTDIISNYGRELEEILKEMNDIK